MNIKMDTLAKEFLEDCTAMHPPREHKPQQLLYEKWALEIRGVKQSSITRDSLYVTLFSPRTLAFWNKRDKLSKIQRIPAGKKANSLYAASPLGHDDGEESFSRIAPVLHLLFKHGNIRTHLLARYEAPEEDRNHLLQCPGPRATHQFKRSLFPLFLNF